MNQKKRLCSHRELLYNQYISSAGMSSPALQVMCGTGGAAMKHGYLV